MEFDVAVIGAGFAGLTVANRVAERGLTPLVVEAGGAELYMCNSRVCTGALHVAFRNPEDSADDLFEAIVSASGGTARRDLARALADRAGPAMDWLRGHGCRFVQHPARAYALPMMAPARALRAGLDWENSGPNLFLRSLAERLEKRGGRIVRGTKAAGIRMEGGRAGGIVAPGVEGGARAVAIADGGFQADRHLLSRHISRRPQDLHQRNMQTGRGDGLRMAVEVGAATTGLDRFYGHVLSRDAFGNEALWPYPQVDVICASGMAVTPDGRRFADEGLGGIYLANAIAGLDDPLSATAIIDAPVWEDARNSDIVPPNPSLSDNGGTVFDADSLEELAAKAGIDASGLAETVAGYNRCIRNGGALLPPKTAARPIESAPFFAIPLCAGITVTSGGIAVDGRGRVLDRNDAPIPGLFAAGSTVGGIEGGPAAGYVGGLIKAFGIGLIAGDAIADELGA